MPRTEPRAARRPPARYDGRPLPLQRTLAVSFGVVVLCLVAALAVAQGQRVLNGNPAASVTGYAVESETAVVVRSDVTKKPQQRAFCIVRARSADGREVGRDVAEVDAEGLATSRVPAEFRLATTGRAVTDEVQGCSDRPIVKEVDPDHHS